MKVSIESMGVELSFGGHLCAIPIKNGGKIEWKREEGFMISEEQYVNVTL